MMPDPHLMWNAIFQEHKQRTGHTHGEDGTHIMPANGCDVCFWLRSWMKDYEKEYYAALAAQDKE